MQNALRTTCSIWLAWGLALGGCSSEGGGFLGGKQTEDKKTDKKTNKVSDKKEGSTSEADQNAASETADEPVWVNGVYLKPTCGWSAPPDDDDVTGVACNLPDNGQEVKLDETATYEWALLDASDANIIESVTTPDTKHSFKVEALKFLDARVVVTARGKSADQRGSSALRTQLAGFKEGTLQTCLETKSAKECFVELKIQTKQSFSDGGSNNPPPPAGPQPSGKLVAGQYWRLADPGVNCRDTCAAHGGATDGTINFAGASIDGCQAVSNALGSFGATQGQALPTNTCNIGCYVAYGQYSWWYGGGSVTHECAANNNMRRVCSCAL